MNKPILKTENYIKLMNDCVSAWNESDAVKTASFYHKNLDYRDPNLPDGIQEREKFIKYLKLLFRKWPIQEWTGKQILNHEIPGHFSVTYHFKFANKDVSIDGFGMDRIEFQEDKIKLNHVYLNASNWPKWIKML
jgi:hypothetical protein